MTLAVSYLRMSTDAQEASIPAQRKAVQQYAAKHGYRIVREYVDSGISGDDTAKRVEFQRMLQDAGGGAFKAILCWDQDRFGRFDLMEAGYWIKPLRDAGVTLVTVGDGVIDWNDFAGRLVYSIKQEGKHQFLRDLSRNVNRGKLAQAQAGKWMGGAAPYGYRLAGKATLAINEDEAETVRLIYAMVADGKSLTGVRDELNRRKIPSPAGVPWRRNAITRIVDNILYCGHIRYNRTSQARYSTVLAGTIVVRNSTGKEVINDKSAWTVVKNAHPAIVTEDEFQAAHKSRHSPFKWSGRPTSRVIAFRGLLKCGRCGCAMQGAWVSVMDDVVYVCASYTEKRACDPNRTYQKPLLAMVISDIRDKILSPSGITSGLQRLEREATTTQKPVATVAGLSKKLTAKRATRARAVQRLVEVVADMMPAVSALIRDLDREILELEHAIQLLKEPKVDRSVDVRKEFYQFISRLSTAMDTAESGSDAVKAAILKEVLDHVDVVSNKLNSKQPKGRYGISSVFVEVKKS